MNIYDRIINILLEARVEMFIQGRIDEIAEIKLKRPRGIMKGPKKPPVKPGAPGSRSAEVLKKWNVGKS